MKFLALSPLAAGALLAAVAAVILLLYLAKPRTLRVVIASTLLWQRVLRTRRRRQGRWRWLLSLALALSAGLSLALALTRPDFRALGGESERIVLILDNSPSMATQMHDGTSRWRRAVESARRTILQAGQGSEILVLDTAGRAGFDGFASRDDALRQLERLPLATAGAARLPPVPFEGAGLRTHLFTDGVALPRPERGVIVHSVFELADNVGLTGFEARPLPNDPTRYQAFVQIFNASPAAQRVRLEITSGSGFAFARDLDLPAGHGLDQIIDVSELEQGILRAQVRAERDAFDLDDVAFAVVAPHRPKRVLLVTSGNAFLEDSLRALPGIALTTGTPAAYTPTRIFDAYVFDRFAPSAAPPAGALLFRPPPAPWLQLALKDARKPAILSWDESHPANAGVDWSEVRLQRALLAAPAADTLAIVSAKGPDEGALLLAGRARAGWLEVGFALEDSNFPLQTAFPVFLGSALAWLTGQVSVIPGQVGHIEVPLPKAEVRDSRGKIVLSSTTVDGTAFDAARPDVLTVRHAGETLTVVANVRDPRYAQVNRSWLSESGADALPGRRGHGFAWHETWTLLLLIAAALLVIEWITFSRRITV